MMVQINIWLTGKLSLSLCVFILSSSEADIPSTADCTFQSSLTLHRITLAPVYFGGQSSIGGGEVRLKDGLTTLAMAFVSMDYWNQR